MSTLGPGPDTGEQIGRNEARSPAFGLADVGLLVIPAAVEAAGVSTDDDVAEGHGGSPAASSQEPV